MMRSMISKEGRLLYSSRGSVLGADLFLYNLYNRVLTDSVLLTRRRLVLLLLRLFRAGLALSNRAHQLLLLFLVHPKGANQFRHAVDGEEQRGTLSRRGGRRRRRGVVDLVELGGGDQLEGGRAGRDEGSEILRSLPSCVEAEREGGRSGS